MTFHRQSWWSPSRPRTFFAMPRNPQVGSCRRMTTQRASSKTEIEAPAPGTPMVVQGYKITRRSVLSSKHAQVIEMLTRLGSISLLVARKVHCQLADEGRRRRTAISFPHLGCTHRLIHNAISMTSSAHAKDPTL